MLSTLPFISKIGITVLMFLPFFLIGSHLWVRWKYRDRRR